MEQAKIRPSVTLYSLDRSSPNLVWLITSATPTQSQSVQRVQSYGGSNFGLLHRNGLSPISLYHDCATRDYLVDILSKSKKWYWSITLLCTLITLPR